jgi:hypothetical protein
MEAGTWSDGRTPFIERQAGNARVRIDKYDKNSRAAKDFSTAYFGPPLTPGSPAHQKP